MSWYIGNLPPMSVLQILRPLGNTPRAKQTVEELQKFYDTVRGIPVRLKIMDEVEVWLIYFSCSSVGACFRPCILYVNSWLLFIGDTDDCSFISIKTAECHLWFYLRYCHARWTEDCIVGAACGVRRNHSTSSGQSSTRSSSCCLMKPNLRQGDHYAVLCSLSFSS